MFLTSKKFFSYYLFSSVLLLISLSGWFYYFQSKGIFDFEKSSWLHDGAIKVEEIKSLNPYGEIKVLINTDQTRESYKIVDRIEKNINVLRMISDKKMSNDLKELLEQNKKLLNNLIGHSEVQTMITVLQNKLDAFQRFVEMNHWKTLSRITVRSNQRLSIFKNKKNNLYSYERLKELQRSISQDLDNMISITDGSVLAVDYKNKIIEQVNNLRTELVMLDKYLSDLIQFEKKSQTMSELYKVWITDTYPKITFAKIEYERSFKMMAMSVVLMIVLMATFIIIGAFIYGIDKKHTRSMMETHFVDLIKNKILATKGDFEEAAGSDIFNNEVNKIQDYIHKRMNFGSIFQSATPFSTILLDENLSLVWGNSHFYEQWGLSSTSSRSDNVTWNYLQQYTNLGEDDPVLQALKYKVAGIYQIQVRTNKNDDFLPYEMYVSPVENSEKTFIMLFFYPLRSLVETITNQTKALVGPISRTLEMLCNESFNIENQKKIKKDYEIAGIDSIHQKFVDYFAFIQSQKKGLMNEITRLENTIFDQNKITDDLVKVVAKIFDNYQSLTGKFNELKTSVVQTVDGRNEIILLFHACNILFKNTFKDVQDLSKACSAQLGLIGELCKGLVPLVTLKDDLKQSKSLADDHKLRLNLSIDQASIFSRSSEANGSRVDQALAKIKLEAKSLEKSVTLLIDGVFAFDIAVSKLLLVSERYETPDIAQTNENLIRAKTYFEDELFKMGKIEKLCASEDEKIINGMKNLFNDLVQFKKGLNQVNIFLSDSKSLLMNGEACKDNSAEIVFNGDTISI